MSTSTLPATSGTHNTTPPRLSHAYPEGSNVALCGTTRKGRPSTGNSQRCPDCEAASRQSFIAR